MVWSVGPTSFYTECILILAPRVKETISSPFNYLYSIFKNELIVRDYFCLLNTILLIFIPTIMPVPPCLDYYSFIVSFEIRKHESCNVVCFQYGMGYSGLLFILNALSHAEWVIFYFELVGCFNHKNAWNVIKAFFCIFSDDCVFYLFFY